MSDSIVMGKVSKSTKINQVPHLTRDTNEKVTNSQLDTTNESQEVSPFPAFFVNYVGSSYQYFILIYSVVKSV